jgi:spore coat polysaccharide biosynthesis protein SpsF
VPGAQCAHEGVDPFSRRALEKLAREAAHEHVAREHVTGYFKVYPDFVRIVHAPTYEALAKESARLTIDTPDDLAFAEAVHARLEAKAGEASLEDLLWLIEREPHLKKINAHVRQKPIDRQGSVALLRCDGGGAFGYGHARRAMMVAKNLRDREGFGIVIALNGDDKAAQMLRDAGFETVRLSQRAMGASVLEIVREITPGIVVCDCREGLTREELAKIAALVPVTAVIDDASDRRFAATHAYYPPVEAAHALGWTDSNTNVRIGWEWAVTGFDPAPYAREKVPNHRLRVAVSMGGSDPFGLTRMVARALAKISAPFYARVLIGPSFALPDLLVREIDALAPNITAVKDADAAAEFAAADLAIVAFGVTAYELAALGVPALYLGLYPDHIESARVFEHMGAGTMLGLGRTLAEDSVARAAWDLLRDGERREAMRKAGVAAIDGRGAERIAADLAQALETSRATKLQAAS